MYFIIHDGRYFYEPITKFTATEYVHSSSNIPHHTVNTQSVSSGTTLWYVTVLLCQAPLISYQFRLKTIRESDFSYRSATDYLILSSSHCGGIFYASVLIVSGTLLHTSFPCLSYQIVAVIIMITFLIIFYLYG